MLRSLAMGWRAGGTGGFLALAALASVTGATESRSGSQAWTRQESMLLLFESLQLIESHSLDPKSMAEWSEWVVTSALSSLDPYSRYLTPLEYRNHQQSNNPSYAGVGMDIVLDKEGSLRCDPLPGSPAARHGIRKGDRLTGVENHPALPPDPARAASLIRGKPGTRVRLFLEREDGTVFSPVVERARVHRLTVERLPAEGPILSLRIRDFTNRTRSELQTVLRTFPLQPDTRIEIDLRDNEGGDLYQAMDAASLFLPNGKPVVTIQRKSGPTDHATSADGPFLSQALYLIQNQHTASAAEVFIAALTGNGRATSSGSRTFGKGITQRILPMSNGGALILTDGILFGPTGISWHDVGLEAVPTRPAFPPPSTTPIDIETFSASAAP